jgi:hypothetical protein
VLHSIIFSENRPDQALKITEINIDQPAAATGAIGVVDELDLATVNVLALELLERRVQIGAVGEAHDAERERAGG